jgi:imidazolonepropionase-like amidohydrolase
LHSQRLKIDEDCQRVHARRLEPVMGLLFRNHVNRISTCACCDPELRNFTIRANAAMSRRSFVAGAAAAAGLGVTSLAPAAKGQGAAPQTVLFEGVRIFDGTSDQLSPPSNVLVEGNLIKTISAGPISIAPDRPLIRIQGGSRTLMPGLIDAHTHLMFETLPKTALMTADIEFVTVAAVRGARDMLMRGFTSVRDMGGPVFGLKRGIDTGLAIGPRIWPSGAFISQSGGHGDFRLPNELPALAGDNTYSERVNAAMIADDPGTVRKRAREQLALGASQIKMMAGGGVSSNYDPLDVTQYTVEELRAGVEAAENWNTYATVHAYTPKAVRQAIEAGCRCIEHGQLLDEATVALIAEKGIWWSLQPFLENPDDTRFPEGSPNRLKQLEMNRGTETAYALAKKHKTKTAWGTDILFDKEHAAKQGHDLVKMAHWYTPFELLKMATSDNAELLALSGLRSPYQGKLGSVSEGALADLLLVDGNPLQNIGLVENPEQSFLVIMKDGQIYKNRLA